MQRGRRGEGRGRRGEEGLQMVSFFLQRDLASSTLLRIVAEGNLHDLPLGSEQLHAATKLHALTQVAVLMRS